MPEANYKIEKTEYQNKPVFNILQEDKNGEFRRVVSFGKAKAIAIRDNISSIEDFIAECGEKNENN